MTTRKSWVDMNMSLLIFYPEVYEFFEVPLILFFSQSQLTQHKGAPRAQQLAAVARISF